MDLLVSPMTHIATLVDEREGHLVMLYQVLYGIPSPKGLRLSVKPIPPAGMEDLIGSLPPVEILVIIEEIELSTDAPGHFEFAGHLRDGGKVTGYVDISSTFAGGPVSIQK